MKKLYKTKKCKICGKLFKPNNSTGCFCSDRCRKEERNIRENRYKKEIREGRILKGMIKGKCSECGKKIFYYKVAKINYKNIFCSRNCKYQFQKKNFIPKNKQNIKIKCKTCGGEFSSCKSLLKLGNKFCSRLCYEIDKKTNWISPLKGIPLEERYGKEKAEEIIKRLKLNMKKYLELNKHPCLGRKLTEKQKKDISEILKKLWAIPQFRKKWLKANGKFKEGQLPWNYGIKLPKEIINKISRTKEILFLNKVGIKCR